MKDEKGADMVIIDELKKQKITISIGFLAAIITALWYGGVFASNYSMTWHDARYAKKTDIITIAQANEITNELEQTNNLASGNEKKLIEISVAQNQLSQDFNTYAASSLVSQAVTDLRNHLTTQAEHTNENQWNEDKARLEERVETAKEYRKCVIDGKKNCGRFLLSRQ